MSSAARFLLVLAVISLGCSSSDDGGNGSGSDGGDVGSSGKSGGSSGKSGGTTGGKGGSTSTGTVDDEPVGDDLTLLFNPMYSAYDGGEHQFKLPAIVQGGLEGIEWSARPADAVDFEPDSETGGVQITTRAAGEVLIIARAGKLSGSAMLYITDTTAELWELGEQRYNNEIPFPDFMVPDAGPDGGPAMVDPRDIMLPDDLSCRNCHSASAEALDVEHTPQQTGGYSDDELISIFTMGEKPGTAKFHTPFPESLYRMFHTWEATDDEKKGLVTYLRSLTPKTQGPLDFQGLADQFM